MIISFIIPVYNTEDYVERCLLSILNQKVSENDYEIVVVNDGSTDGSAKILSDFENKYSGVKIITQENRGLGAARNVAFLQAKGDYIFYVDSDDYILPNAISELIGFTRNHYYSDIICFNTQREISGKRKIQIDRSYFKENAISGEDYLSKYNLYPCPCSSIFSRAFLIENSLFMPEGIFYEDHLFTLKAFMYAKEIRVFNLPIYVYVKREGSITNPLSFNEEKRLIKDFIFTITELNSLIRQENITMPQKRGIENRIIIVVVLIFIELTRCPYNRRYIETVLNELSSLALFPIPRRSDSWKHNLFRMLFKNKTRTLFFLRLGIRL